MDYCDKCRKKNGEKFEQCEWEYKEIQMFCNYIENDLGKKFSLLDCPDKNPETKYTCDLVLREESASKKIYIEVKTVLYGFENSEDVKKKTAGKNKKTQNSTIEQNNGQRLCMQLISSVIDCCDESKMVFLWDFVITIPQLQIGVQECKEFCRQLEKFLNETSFEEDEYCFIYERSRGKAINIPFIRKNDELREMFDENVAFQYDISGDGQLSAIFERLTDVKSLRKLLTKNADSTSEKNKFPETEDRKILLNILRLPQGFETFFDLNIETISEELKNGLDDYKSTADESYLLYYSPDYQKTKVNEDGTYECKQFDERLFIIPLIKGLVTEIIAYCGTDN